MIMIVMIIPGMVSAQLDMLANVGLDNVPSSYKLSLISYNCEYANNVRLPFMKELYSNCDFLFIQEHGLFKSRLSWFHKLGNDVVCMG